MTHVIHPTQHTQPTGREFRDALHRLYIAICSGHHRLADGTRGHDEYIAAMRQARRALQADNFGRDTAERLPY